MHPKEARSSQEEEEGTMRDLVEAHALMADEWTQDVLSVISSASWLNLREMLGTERFKRKSERFKIKLDHRRFEARLSCCVHVGSFP